MNLDAMNLRRVVLSSGQHGDNFGWAFHDPASTRAKCPPDVAARLEALPVLED